MSVSVGELWAICGHNPAGASRPIWRHFRVALLPGAFFAWAFLAAIFLARATAADRSAVGAHPQWR